MQHVDGPAIVKPSRKTRKRRTIASRLWAQIDRGTPSECWPWGGHRSSGYGVICRKKAHRVVYEVMYGPIPPGLNVLHRCDNPPCCNPAHLFLGTQAANVRDMIAKGRDRKCHGERHRCAKLSAADVAALRAAAKVERTSKLAAQFGISPGHVRKIVRGANWA